jgi:isoquinoline 1-oxidoreductase beta subunit
LTLSLSRRSALAGAGALVLSVAVAGPRGALAAAGAAAPTLTAFLTIQPDGSVRLASPTTEMGQGTHAAHAAIIAEELGVALARVAVETPNPSDPFRRNGNMGSGGSWGVRFWHAPLRKAAAQAREMLVAEAASRFGVPAADLTVADGVVRHGARTLAGIGALAAGAAARPVPEAPVLRPVSQRTLSGTRFPRADLPAKVAGKPVFAIDQALPGMVYACARLAPVYRAEVASLDEAPARAIKGVQAVVSFPGGAAVVASNSWAAMKGAAALGMTLKPTAHDGLDSAGISAAMRAALDSPTSASSKTDGDFDAALKAAARVVEADYEVPYLAHTPLEPWNATVRFNPDGSLEVWAPTQAQDRLLNALTRASDLPAARITIHTTHLGGGFGRRLRDDEGIIAAVLTAKAVGKPVLFFWTREDEIGQGWYRPAQVARLKATLDATGAVTGLSIRTAGPSMIMDFAPRPPIQEGGLDGSSVQSLADTRYRPGAYRLDYVMRRFPIPTAPWTAVGSTQNGYFIECFLDEVARAAGQDPYQLRRRLLAHDARALKVIDTVAEKSGWGTPLPAGRARGMAYVESYGSLCAHVVEASLEAGMPKVHKVVVALDCGSIVSRDGVISQVEGRVIQGLSAALGEAVDIAGGAAVNRNLDSYTLMRMPDAPAVIETHIIESGETMGGVGEPPLPPAAPALVNALYALTGKPIRTLPILKALSA